MLVEAGAAMLTLAAARGLDVAHANEAWAGAAAAMVSAAGLRSSFLDWGETPIGVRSATDFARKWLERRLRVQAAIVASARAPIPVRPLAPAAVLALAGRTPGRRVLRLAVWPLLGLSAYMTLFFRDPDRACDTTPPGPDEVLSPADGVRLVDGVAGTAALRGTTDSHGPVEWVFSREWPQRPRESDRQ